MWLLDKFHPRPADNRLYPECLWTVTIEAGRIVIVDNKGRRQEIAAGNLAGVAVETNDSGPGGIDFWWLLNDAETGNIVGVPQGASGEQAMIDIVLKLPGADIEEFGRAMASTENAVFLIWNSSNAGSLD